MQTKSEVLLISSEIKENLKSEVMFLSERKNLEPHLVVITLEKEACDLRNIQLLGQICQEVGIRLSITEVPKTASLQNMIELIQILNNSPEISGISIQIKDWTRPEAQVMIQNLDPSKDVEGVHPVNRERLRWNLNGMVPCHLMSLLTLIKNKQPKLKGKHILISGPLTDQLSFISQWMIHEKATITFYQEVEQTNRPLIKADLIVKLPGSQLTVEESLMKDDGVLIAIDQEEFNLLEMEMLLSNTLKTTRKNL